MIFFWIAFYGIAHCAGVYLTSQYGAADWIYAAVMLMYTVLLILWTSRKGNCRPVYLCAAGSVRFRSCGLFLPLAALPVCNLLAGGFRFPDAAEVLIMLSASVAEELFFRGYLLSFLRRKGDLFAIPAASILFALFHFVNWQGPADSVYVLMQVLTGFSVGICYCCIAVRFGSILPCMAAHFLTNITGSGSIEGVVHLWGLAACIVINLCYGILLFRSAKQTTKETVS